MRRCTAVAHRRRQPIDHVLPLASRPSGALRSCRHRAARAHPVEQAIDSRSSASTSAEPSGAFRIARLDRALRRSAGLKGAPLQLVGAIR